MSKRSGSITCFLGTRKGVLTNRPARLSEGDLERLGRFAKRQIGPNWAFSGFFAQTAADQASSKKASK
jgi:hypothetical protein